MKSFLYFLIFISCSVSAFSQVTFRLSKHVDTILHHCACYIVNVEDNRKTGKKESIVGRLHAIAPQNLVLRKGPSVAFYKFYNTIYPRRSSDTVAVTVIIDSINYNNKQGLVKVSVSTRLSLRFINAHTNESLYSFTGEKEAHGAILPLHIYRNLLQDLLIQALISFDNKGNQP